MFVNIMAVAVKYPHFINIFENQILAGLGHMINTM